MKLHKYKAIFSQKPTVRFKFNNSNTGDMLNYGSRIA